MTHNLNLHPLPFKLIKEGKKDIEMRLFDERRKNIKVGDHILFTNNETKEELEVVVISLKTFKDFEELYQHFDKNRLGYLEDEIADPKDMNIYYDDERIKKYGVLAIEIELIK